MYLLLKRALLRVAVAAVSFFGVSVAHADSVVRYCEGAWCVQPATAVGWVVNVQTGDIAQASSLVGVSLVRDGGIPLGFGLYGGSVFSSGGARPALAALFSVANFAAAGPGVVMFKSDGQVDYALTANLSFNLNHGGP